MLIRALSDIITDAALRQFADTLGRSIGQHISQTLREANPSGSRTQPQLQPQATPQSGTDGNDSNNDDGGLADNVRELGIQSARQQMQAELHSKLLSSSINDLNGYVRSSAITTNSSTMALNAVNDRMGQAINNVSNLSSFMNAMPKMLTSELTRAGSIFADDIRNATDPLLESYIIRDKAKALAEEAQAIETALNNVAMSTSDRAAAVIGSLDRIQQQGININLEELGIDHGRIDEFNDAVANQSANLEELSNVIINDVTRVALPRFNAELHATTIALERTTRTTRLLEGAMSAASGFFSKFTAMALATVAVTKTMEGYRDAMKFGTDTFFKESLAMGMSSSEVSEIVAANKQAAIAGGREMVENAKRIAEMSNTQVASEFSNVTDHSAVWLNEIQKQQKSWAMVTGDWSEAARIPAQTISLFRQLGISGDNLASVMTLEADVIDSNLNTFKFLQKTAGVLAPQFVAMQEDLLSNADARQSLMKLDDKQRLQYVKSINLRLQENIAIGMIPEQAKRATQALNELAGVDPMESIESSAILRAVGGGLGFGEEANVLADFMLMSAKQQNEMSSTDKKELTTSAISINDKIQALLGDNNIAVRLQAAEMLKQLKGVEKLIGKDSEFNVLSKETLALNEQQVDAIRGLREEQSVGDELGIPVQVMFLQKIFSAIRNNPMVAGVAALVSGVGTIAATLFAGIGIMSLSGTVAAAGMALLLTPLNFIKSAFGKFLSFMGFGRSNNENDANNTNSTDSRSRSGGMLRFAKILLTRWLPGISSVIYAITAITSMFEGEFKNALIEFASGVISLIPVIGPIAAAKMEDLFKNGTEIDRARALIVPEVIHAGPTGPINVEKNEIESSAFKDALLSQLTEFRDIINGSELEIANYGELMRLVKSLDVGVDVSRSLSQANLVSTNMLDKIQSAIKSFSVTDSTKQELMTGIADMRQAINIGNAEATTQFKMAASVANVDIPSSISHLTNAITASGIGDNMLIGRNMSMLEKLVPQLSNESNPTKKEDIGNKIFESLTRLNEGLGERINVAETTPEQKIDITNIKKQIVDLLKSSRIINQAIRTDVIVDVTSLEKAREHIARNGIVASIDSAQLDDLSTQRIQLGFDSSGLDAVSSTGMIMRPDMSEVESLVVPDITLGFDSSGLDAVSSTGMIMRPDMSEVESLVVPDITLGLDSSGLDAVSSTGMVMRPDMSEVESLVVPDITLGLDSSGLDAVSSTGMIMRPDMSEVESLVVPDITLGFDSSGLDAVSSTGMIMRPDMSEVESLVAPHVKLGIDSSGLDNLGSQDMNMVIRPDMSEIESLAAQQIMLGVDSSELDAINVVVPDSNTIIDVVGVDKLPKAILDGISAMSSNVDAEVSPTAAVQLPTLPPTSMNAQSAGLSNILNEIPGSTSDLLKLAAAEFAKMGEQKDIFANQFANFNTQANPNQTIPPTFADNRQMPAYEVEMQGDIAPLVQKLSDASMKFTDGLTKNQQNSEITFSKLDQIKKSIDALLINDQSNRDSVLQIMMELTTEIDKTTRRIKKDGNATLNTIG